MYISNLLFAISQGRCHGNLANNSGAKSAEDSHSSLSHSETDFNRAYIAMSIALTAAMIWRHCVNFDELQSSNSGDLIAHLYTCVENMAKIAMVL